MKVESEIKKINVANNLQSAEVHVIYSIKDYTRLEEFKDKLKDFQLMLQNQKRLTK